MGRSVSVPSDAVYVCYATLPEDYDEDYRDDLQWEFGQALEARFKSFQEDVRFIDREDQALVSNAFVYAGLSEYCGMVSCWMALRADEELEPLALNWAAQAEKGFAEVVEQVFGNRYVRDGAMSNGGGVYRRVSP